MLIENIYIDNYIEFPSNVDSVFGARIIYKKIIESLIRYGRIKRINFSAFNDSVQKLMIERFFYQVRSKNPEIELNIYNKREIAAGRKFVKADIWHNTSDNFLSTLYGREYLSENKPPMTYTVHCASKSNELYDGILMQTLLRFQKYDSIICSSNAVKTAVKKQFEIVSDAIYRQFNIKMDFEGRLDVVPLGVDTDIFKPGDKYTERKEYGIPENATVMMWLGRFSAYDKADLLPMIRVFKKIYKDYDNLYLVMVGHDVMKKPYLPYLKKIILEWNLSDRVIIIEKNDVSKRHKLLACADIFLSPIDSVQETFGLTPIEAMACGVPQIVSDWNGYKETVEEGVTGFRIPTLWLKCDRDISASNLFFKHDFEYEAFYSHFLMGQTIAVDLVIFEKKLRLLIENEGLRAEMSANSVAAAKKFAWKNIIRKYEDLWSELIRIHKIESYKHNEIGWDIIGNKFYYTFSHYSSVELQTNEKLFAADDQYEFIDQNYYNMGDYTEMSIAGAILEEYHGRFTAEGLSAADIVAGNELGYSKDEIYRAIMFLIKNGYLTSNIWKGDK